MDNTRTKILAYLLGDELTALDLKERLQINESAVRKHMDKLEGKGLVEHHFKKVSKGRPKKLFSITDKGRGLFPRQMGLLVDGLFKALVSEYGEEEVGSLMEQVADNIYPYIVHSIMEEDPKERLEAAVENFEEMGFFCSLSSSGDAYTIEYKNCIFSDVSEEYGKMVCRVHTSLMQRIVGDDVEIEHENSILQGDDNCVQMIKLDDR